VPIQSCTLPEGGSGFRWGQHGKCYAERTDAERQEAAARANGWAEDEEPRTLYVSRKVTNEAALVEWAHAQGFAKTMPAGEMHVTIAYSKTPVAWSAAGDSFATVRASDASEDVKQRSIAQLGAQGAIVLTFDNPDLRRRWQEFRDAGASWDWPDYKPHVTITYEPGDVDLSKVEPYTGPIEFGPELYAEVDEDWVSKVKPAMDKIAADKLAFDRASVRTYDQDGRMRVEMTNISKACVNPYLGSEIPDGDRLGLDPKRVYQLLRDPEELAKAAETFNGVPLLDTHVPSTAWDHPKGKVVGTTGTDAVFEAPYLKNSLIVWTADAIQGIESGEQRELSCGYRYRADMTPGTYDGVQYDGVMRDIRGNHVALVAAGRAGPDVVVGDSQLETTKETGMTKKALSPKAHTARGALMAHLKPLLAADAKLDLPAILQGVTAKNWKESKAKIVAAVKPKIAADADIQEIVKLLDSLDDIEDAQDDTPDPNATPAPGADATPADEIAAMLKGKVDDATLAAVMEKCKALSAPAAAADVDDPEKNKDMVSKSAMDAALKAAKVESDKAIKLASDSAARDAEQRTIARLQEIDAAREFAKTCGVGTLAGAFDSAEAVYRAALDAKGVKHQEVKDVAALRLILEAQPKPGQALGMDSRNATPQGFADRFPGAAAVRTI
jgi:uncharacterized protein